MEPIGKKESKSGGQSRPTNSDKGIREGKPAPNFPPFPTHLKRSHITPSNISLEYEIIIYF
jgi:hypothetical protein